MDAEYVFTDTGRELPEVYEFLDKLEMILGPIQRIQSWGRDFDWHLETKGYFLPSPFVRWCTTELKLRPFKRHIGKDDAIVYIALRADEDRQGNYGTDLRVEYRYPLIDEGIDLQGVRAILAGAAIELPDFYRWRATGGCWCCPFQRKSDWAGLKMFHPDLFANAVQDEEKSGKFTWRPGMKLKQIEAAWQPPLDEDEVVIYNWRDGKNFLGAQKGKPVTRIKAWNVASNAGKIDKKTGQAEPVLWVKIAIWGRKRLGITHI
ncbi:hypothetical protein LCGC14_1302410 [marine sediment metagenome]|uniref:Phosphoadenosine phosphosulphate reductase domain-containing protein n=1 Tax=marine sediment metagenome TaxID=412755 RepID=A0A0F9KPK1_9ZZZZ